jgi:hypothetical protein
MNKITLLAAVLILTLSSCKKDFNLDKWAPEMLGPIATGTATIEDVADLKDKIFTQKIYPPDIGVTGISIPVSVSSISLGFVGPYPYQVSEYFKYVYVDSAIFKITFDNTFPVVVEKGTRIDFRSSADTSSPANIIFSHTLDREIAPNSSYSFTTVVVNTNVQSIMYLYLQNFKARNPGGTNIVFDPNPSTLTFEIKFLSVFKIAVYTNKEYEVRDTVAIDYGDSFTPNEYNDSAVVGKLTLYLTNKIPINFDFQMYFWNESFDEPIDSFYYGRMNIAAATTNFFGDPVNFKEDSFPVPITAARSRVLKKAKYVSYRLSGNTRNLGPDELVFAGKDCVIEAQFVGDLKIRVSNFFTFLN